jgi:hypothetical protein
MYRGATAFNQEIGNWDTAHVTLTSYMCRIATAFNNKVRVMSKIVFSF